MAFCPNCGVETSGRFCPNCGTDVTVAAASGPQPAWSAAPPPAGYPSAGLSQNAASALCYALGFVTGIVFLLIAPYNANKAIRFHAFQSIFLSLAAFAIDRVLTLLLFDVLHLWRLLGWGFMSLVHLFWFILWVYMLFTTANGKTVKLPVIGEFAQNQA